MVWTVEILGQVGIYLALQITNEDKMHIAGHDVGKGDSLEVHMEAIGYYQIHAHDASVKEVPIEENVHSQVLWGVKSVIL